MKKSEREREWEKPKRKCEGKKKGKERKNSTHCSRDHQGPAVTRVGVCDDGHVTVQAGDHAGVADHVVDGGEAQIGHAKDAHGRAGAGLRGER